ncbi:MAG: hypothetical protein M3O07_06105 [Pseudomonadota bacterium]|nr:hypothetical protein [Pseudomonadota bacterium]
MRMLKLALALMLTLNGSGWSAASGASPADAGPPAHHEQADMMHMAGAGDCCDEETMDCECGCMVPQLAGFGVPAAVRGFATLAAPAHCQRAQHPLSSWTTPFRPPA